MKAALVGIFAAALLVGTVHAEERSPIDAHGLRGWYITPPGTASYVLDFMSIIPWHMPGNDNIEDRAVLIYDTHDLVAGYRVTLDVWIKNNQPDPAFGDGGINVYVTNGGPTVTLEHWNAGSWIGTWTVNPGVILHHFQLDVTHAAIGLSPSGYLTFRFTGFGRHVWHFGPNSGLPYPTLVIDAPTAIRSPSWGQLKARYH